MPQGPDAGGVYAGGEAVAAAGAAHRHRAECDAARGGAAGAGVARPVLPLQETAQHSNTRRGTRIKLSSPSKIVLITYSVSIYTVYVLCMYYYIQSTYTNKHL